MPRSKKRSTVPLRPVVLTGVLGLFAVVITLTYASAQLNKGGLGFSPVISAGNLTAATTGTATSPASSSLPACPTYGSSSSAPRCPPPPPPPPPKCLYTPHSYLIKVDGVRNPVFIDSFSWGVGQLSESDGGSAVTSNGPLVDLSVSNFLNAPMSQGQTTGQTGQTSQTRNFQPLRITKKLDRSSPELASLAINGTKIKSVTLQQTPSSDEVGFTIVFQDATLFPFAERGFPATDFMEFTFKKVASFTVQEPVPYKQLPNSNTPTSNTVVICPWANNGSSSSAFNANPGSYCQGGVCTQASGLVVP